MGSHPADSNQNSTNGNEAVSKEPPSDSGKKQKPRRLFKKLAIASLILLVVAASGIGGAEYYTARPDFCGSCHIMDPYYDSWVKDKHGHDGQIWCVDCHYAPGEHHTFMAKFRGLSQAASYFSGRAGGSRPRAHVNDASCMTSKCHGDGKFLDDVYRIGETRMEKRIVGGVESEVERKPTVTFSHAKHLKVDERLDETIKAIELVVSRIKSGILAEQFEAIRSAAMSVEPADVRDERMRDVTAKLGSAELLADSTEWMRLEHVKLRLAQLEGINCAACHTYDASGDNHFAVDNQTCFTCHFTNQHFNRDTGECLRCHEPPTRMIQIHARQPGLTSDATSTSSPTLMDHRDIVERKIDCVSCHFDVIKGSATVSARDCTHCHDQSRFAEDFEKRTTETVAEYHRLHVMSQRARCQDCHRNVTHQLVDSVHVGSSEEFLKPVLNDCQHCHPGHHSEQVNLLMGRGGEGDSREMPNAMFGSRLNCRACHSLAGSDFKGDPLIKATEQTCIACHGSDYDQLFNQWLSELQSVLTEAETSLQRVDERVRVVAAQGRLIPPDVTTAISQARFNINFVKTGNGIHNKNYALHLLDISMRDLDSAMIKLSK